MREDFVRLAASISWAQKEIKRLERERKEIMDVCAWAYANIIGSPQKELAEQLAAILGSRAERISRKVEHIIDQSPVGCPWGFDKGIIDET